MLPVLAPMPVAFDQLLARWDWRPIPRCPGRYVVSRWTLTPQELAGEDVGWREFRVEAARDPVLVAEIPGGGLISYRRADKTCVHTLNTPDGFARKLQQLGIRL